MIIGQGSLYITSGSYYHHLDRQIRSRFSYLKVLLRDMESKASESVTISRFRRVDSIF